MALTPLVLATDYSGANLGAKINAADADLGASPGIIVVPPGNYTLSTQVVLGAGGGARTLILGDGIYDNNITTFCPFLLKDNCSIVAANKWGAQVYETVNRTVQGDITSVIQDYISVGDNTINGNSNLSVNGLKFLPKAATLDAISGTILFGNCTNVSVKNCFFYQTSAFCMSAGGSSASGKYADGVDFSNNVMIEAGTQNIAAVNCRQVRILDNYMKSGGAGGRGFSTFIDCETNSSTDWMENVLISRNIVDARGGYGSSPGTGIAVLGNQGLSLLAKVQNIQVLDNQIIATADDDASAYLATGVVISRAQNVTVARNRITGVGQSGITIGISKDVVIEHNDLVDCVGVTDDYQTQIYLLYSQFATVRFNNLINQGGATNHEQGITESNISETSDACDHNHFYGNRIVHTDDSAAHEAHIILSGPNSRAWNNTFNNETVDAPAAVSTCAALTAGTVPGARHANNPPLALVNGYLTVGDWRPRWFKFASASTATHNGITIIKPHNLGGGDAGRWIIVPDDPVMDDTARNAITWVTGDKGFRIFNTTAGKTQEWDGSAWQNLW